MRERVSLREMILLKYVFDLIPKAKKNLCCLENFASLMALKYFIVVK